MAPATPFGPPVRAHLSRARDRPGSLPHPSRVTSR